MTTNLFDNLQRQLERQNIVSRSTEARKWLESKVQNLRQSAILRDAGRQKNSFSAGKMYFFAYDPKLKTELPYYDRFPLVIPIEQYSDGFLGLNLHYVPPNYRAKLLDKMMDIATNNKFDDRTRFRVSYDLLNGSSRYDIFRPCVKRYLYTHIASKFIHIEANEWDIAIFLPFERFVGASRGKVYSESIKRI